MSMLRAASLLLALPGALLLGGCATKLPVMPTDRAAAITVEDFAEWVAPFLLAPKVDTFEKTTQMGFYSLSYRYHGVSERVEFVLNSEVMITREEAEARSAFRSFVMGARIGAEELVEAESTLDWPDQAAVYKSLVDGRQIGNVYVGRRGNVTVMVAVGGLHDTTSSFFERTLEPCLWELTRYDPEAVSGEAVARR